MNHTLTYNHDDPLLSLDKERSKHLQVIPVGYMCPHLRVSTLRIGRRQIYQPDGMPRHHT